MYVQTCQLPATFQVFKGGQKEKIEAAGTPSHLVTLDSNRVIYPILMILVRIRGFVAFQTRSLPILLACCLYKVDHSGAGRQCNGIVLVFQGTRLKISEFCLSYFSKSDLYVSSRAQGTFLPLAEPLLLMDTDS